MGKLKIAIIGVGSIAQEHIRAYQANPLVELYAFCDINPQRLALMGQQHGISNCYTDQALMHEKHPEIDAVSICVWNSSHADCTIMALNAGCHVLCEKPLATSTAEARKMQLAAQANDRLLMVGFVCRFGRDCLVVEDFIQQDFFGDIYYAKANYLRRNGNPGGWFSDKSRSAGGPLIDLGVHVIDLTRFLMGNPEPVSVYGATFTKLYNRPGIKDGVAYMSVEAGQDDICDVEDLAVALVRYENGAVLEVSTSFSLNIKNDIYTQELFGSKGGVMLAPELEFYKDINGYMTNISLADPAYYKDESMMFVDEVDHFIDCLTKGTSCRAPAEDGVAIMRILDAIYESAKTGHEVILA